jgi:hypothetical protein
MKHLVLVHHSEHYRSMTLPRALNDAMGKFITDAFASGTLVETEGLKGTSESVSVKSKGGKVTVTDGPYTEAKEMIGGFAMLDVASKDEAVAFARDFMALHAEHWPEFEGACEVRPLDR